MPDFHLSEDEAGLLADYLHQRTQGSVTPIEKLTVGDTERGKKLFAELRCDHCHQVSPASILGEPDVRPAMSGGEKGCLRKESSPGSSAPWFAWSDRERNELNDYLGFVSHGKSVSTGSPSMRIQRSLSSLRCTSCHAHDTESARWPEIVVEEGSGKLPEAVPQLTWVGEKLQGPWVAKLLKGDVHHKPRPWLTARMPGFPAFAEFLSREFAAEHGVAYQEAVPTEFDPRLVEVGRKLTQRDGGLDCRQCHGIGNERPQGDSATQIALGINFAFTRERLRPEFALRQILDPPRYDIGSRMPRFAPDLQTTAAKQIEGGNARKQFDAIKQYLWSLKLVD